VAVTSASPPAAGDVVPIRIDTLTLQGGRIGLADHFIQPNYSATLADLAGRVTGLSSREGTVAQLDVRGRLANHSPFQIAGSINPLAAAAFADVKASVRDIDLPPFTPYSGKYAGYIITRGALTMEVSYKLQNRKLTAQNRFLVDQFEFGEKVESKAATKLPVKLAVSLLKDRTGVIDLDLPIEGSLDDPKFRIGKVVWKLIGNLIGKAVTAPFALLGKLFGGGGQELSSVDFADGRDAPDEAAKKKLDALAKALESRPALKLEATGRFSGEKDREGLRRLRLDRKVKAQKLADLAKMGEAPASVDDVAVGENEYEALLKKAYKKEKFPKPRNVLGIAKDLPAQEMENLMLANLPVTDDDMRQLALSRANAVKDYLTGPGKIEVARVFVLEPGEKPAELTGKARASRVDFSLR
jgi:outer membrane protein OmpA-like peptidoglycan-associated protein